MGSRANIVVIEDGNTKFFYHQWVAQHMDVLIIFGESSVRSFLQHECDTLEDDSDLMDNVWAEGGLLLDCDHRQLMWFGGENGEGCKPYLEAFNGLLSEAWPGWIVRWANKGNYDFAVYLGYGEDELERIAGDRLELAGDNLHSIARDSPDDQVGIITIRGAEGCFSRPVGCLYIEDLLSFGSELESLYESMVSSEQVVIDERPERLFQGDVEWAVDPKRAEREWNLPKDSEPWATLVCGFAHHEFPKYGIYMDLEHKYMEYWDMWGYRSNPINRSLFPDDWTIVDKGVDCSSHFSNAGDSITLNPCDRHCYFPVIEGWTIRLVRIGCVRGGVGDLSSQDVKEYFKELYAAYEASHPDISLGSLVEEVFTKPEASVNAPLGLPDPEPYDGERFSVLDYEGPRYAEARTLGEAIEMRGYDAFVKRLDSADIDDIDPTMECLGYAELWADSTWRKSDPSARHVEEERAAWRVSEGDALMVMVDAPDCRDEEIAFYGKDGIKLPYSPYHDYDEMNFDRWLGSLQRDQRLVCKVDSATCFGEDGVRPDPDFCWRVYACKVTVYKVTQ